MNKLMSWKGKTVAVVVGVLGTSVVAQAADYSAQIGTAATDGTSNVTAVIAAVIGVAILGFGVGSMMGWFKR